MEVEERELILGLSRADLNMIWILALFFKVIQNKKYVPPT